MSFPTVGEMFLGRYRIDGVLGKGGFATVFEAHDSAAQRRVALKVLKPDGSHSYPEEVVSRFTREVRIVANLRDPHTVTMFDFGTSSDGLLYMVFEHVPGEDLSELIERRGALPEAEAIHIIVQVLRSLREAHRSDLLHRDIKPENIRVYEYAGDALRVKVLDFGIARPAQSESSRITRPGEIVGTPRYMSPEQLLEKELTPASDLYSVGLVALDLLLGRSPVQGNSWTDQLDRLKDEHVFAMPQSAPISPRTRSVVGRMCSRQAANRFQSADDVLRALGYAASSDSISHDQLRRALGSSQDQLILAPSSASQSAIDVAAVDPEPLATTKVRRKPGARSATHKLLGAALLGLVSVFVTLAYLVQTRVIDRSDAESEKPVFVPKTRSVAIVKTAAPKPPPPAVTVDAGHASHGSPDASTTDGGDANSTAGCGRPAGPKGFRTMRNIDGLAASSWTVYLPRGYTPDKPHAVVFLFHDAGQSPGLFLQEARFDDLADETDVVLIAPQDDMIVDGTGFYGRVWETDRSVERVLDVWRSAQDQLCLDPSRVYAVGHAAGGYAAERLGCLMPLAGVATNAHVKVPTDRTCAPDPPVPYIMLLGDDDGYVPREGEVNCANVQKFSWAEKAERWRGYNACGAKRRTYLKERNGTCYTWDCDVPVVSCELKGGREWPGARPRVWDQFKNCAGQPANFPSAPTVFEFFAKTGLGAK